MLILEGSDLAGKTTLAERFRQRVVHPWRATSIALGKLPAHWDYFLDYAKLDGPLVIADRFVHSELVYGPLLRGQVNPDLSHANCFKLRLVQRQLLTTGSVVVHVNPCLEVLEGRFMARDDAVVREIAARRHIKPMEALRLLHLAFRRLFAMKSQLLPVLEVWGEPGDEELETQVLNCWINRARRALELEQLGACSWGSLYPEVLLVGERFGTESIGKDSWERPFASGQCARFLTRLLQRAGVEEPRLHIVNAYGANGDLQPLVELRRFLKPRSVIALGREAEAALKAVRVPHALFPHPQHSRRFKRREFEHLARALRVLALGGAS